MSEQQPPSGRIKNLLLIGAVLLLTFALALWVDGSKVRYFVLALEHRITPENVPLILSAIAWPLTVVFSVLVLRVALRSMIDRIKSASVGGDSGPLLQFQIPEKTTPASAPPQAPAPVSGIPFAERVRSHVANTYWLGADLMTLFDVVLRGGKRDEMLRMFRQADHHMKILNLKSSPLYERLRKLYDTTEASLESDWTAARRLELAREIHSIAGGFGHLLERTQQGFSGDAQTSDNL